MEKNNTIKILTSMVILILVGTIVGIAVATIAMDEAEEVAHRRAGHFPDPWAPPPEFHFDFIWSFVFVSINLFLLLGLLGLYIYTYTKTKSSFMLGLIIFLGVLAIQAFLSLPFLHTAFGFSSFGLGIFAVIPHIFETFALVILFILSSK